MMNKDDWNEHWKSSFPLVIKLGFNKEKDAIREIFKNMGLKKDISIIEFGCGEGRTLKYIRELGFKNSIGIDSSEEAIKKCLLKDFELNKDVFLADKSPNGRKYDLLFSQGLLEHYKKEEWSKIIRQMTKLSKKFIVLMQPLTTSITYKIINHFINYYSDFWGCIKEYDYSIDEYIKAFSKQCFIKKMVRTTHGFPTFLDTSVIIALEKEKNEK